MAHGVVSAFQNAGSKVILGGDKAEDDPLHVTYVPATLSNPDILTTQLAECPFNIVILSPDWFEQGSFMDTKPGDIGDAMTINFEQATFGAQAAAKSMITRNQAGTIIFLSSVAGLMPMIHTNLVGSSLAALHVIARMAAVDLAPHHIRVNVVAAGWVDETWSGKMLTGDGLMHTPEDIPLGNSGSVQSIGDACCFLASPMASYITGTIIPVDGGFLLTKSAAGSPIRS